MKAMFTLTVFEILLLEGRLVLPGPTQQVTGSKRVKKGKFMTKIFFQIMLIEVLKQVVKKRYLLM